MDTTLNKILYKYPNSEFVIPCHFSWKNHSGIEHTLKTFRTE